MSVLVHFYLYEEGTENFLRRVDVKAKDAHAALLKFKKGKQRPKAGEVVGHTLVVPPLAESA